MYGNTFAKQIRQNCFKTGHMSGDSQSPSVNFCARFPGSVSYRLYRSVRERVFRPRNGGEAYRLGYSWMDRVRLFLRVEPELHLNLSWAP